MALTLRFCEFKENCNINNAITDCTRKENEFSIHIYCPEKDIAIKKKEIVCCICIINMDFPTTCAMGSELGAAQRKKNNFYKTNSFFDVYF